MEFQIDRFEPGGLVVGRNGYSDVPVGTVFVALTKRRLDGEVPNLTDVDLGDVAAMSFGSPKSNGFGSLWM